MFFSNSENRSCAEKKIVFEKNYCFLPIRDSALAERPKYFHTIFAVFFYHIYYINGISIRKIIDTENRSCAEKKIVFEKNYCFLPIRDSALAERPKYFHTIFAVFFYHIYYINGISIRKIIDTENRSCAEKNCSRKKLLLFTHKRFSPCRTSEMQICIIYIGYN